MNEHLPDADSSPHYPLVPYRAPGVPATTNDSAGRFTPGADKEEPDGLEPGDEEALQHLEAAFDVVRDRVRQVVDRIATGLLLCGRGGLGKSYVVTKTLEACRVPWATMNTHLTPRGLFNFFSDHSDAVVLIEDAEHALKHPVMSGILRSALWSQFPMLPGGLWPRPITWTTSRGAETVVFTGGLVIITNSLPPDTPEVEAMKSRICCMDLKIPPEQTAAKMRQLAARGYRNGTIELSSEVCLEVCRFVIERSTQQNRPLNLRDLINAFADRYSYDQGDAVTPWRTLVETRLRRESTTASRPLSPQERRERDLDVVAEILAKAKNMKEAERMFEEATGESRSTFYRRKRILEQRNRAA